MRGRWHVIRDLSWLQVSILNPKHVIDLRIFIIGEPIPISTNGMLQLLIPAWILPSLQSTLSFNLLSWKSYFRC